MKTLFLLPPSEGKNEGGDFQYESTSFGFDKPCDIAVNASKKDLKCSGKKYEQGIYFNKSLCNGTQKQFMKSIHRYSGVMYNNISYESMKENAQKFFDNKFLILSGMYGLLRPKDIIGNYKLPIETKGLYDYWWDKIPKAILDIKPDCIVNLLSQSYATVLGFGTTYAKHKKKKDILTNAGIKIINVNFFENNGNKLAHSVKKIKGEFIRNICGYEITDYNNFGGDVVDNGDFTLDINIKV